MYGNTKKNYWQIQNEVKCRSGSTTENYVQTRVVYITFENGKRVFPQSLSRTKQLSEFWNRHKLLGHIYILAD